MVYAQHLLSFLGVWNLGTCRAEGACRPSPQREPRAPNLPWALQGNRTVVHMLLHSCCFGRKALWVASHGRQRKHQEACTWIPPIPPYDPTGCPYYIPVWKLSCEHNHILCPRSLIRKSPNVGWSWGPWNSLISRCEVPEISFEVSFSKMLMWSLTFLVSYA